jgi:hypothetical protein
MKTPDGWCSDAELEWLSHAAGVREALDACAITYQREAGSIWREC